MKTTGAFKLPASVKRVLTLIPDKAKRAEVRKLFIDAEQTKATMANRRTREKSASAAE